MWLNFNYKANNGITSARCVAAIALFIPHVFFELVLWVWYRRFKDERRTSCSLPFPARQ